MFKRAIYSFQFDAKGAPSVVVDTQDGYKMDFTQPELEEAIKNIQAKRRKYASQAEWVCVLAVFRGALEFLKMAIAAERR